MINKRFLILALFSSFVITGCSTIPEPQVIIKHKTTYKSIPTDLLEPCFIPKPMEKKEYLKLNSVEREIALTDYSIDLIVYLGFCNIKINSIKEFNVKHIKLYSEPVDKLIIAP